MKSRLILLFAVLTSLFPCHLYAQTISTGSLRSLPVNNPWMLLGLVLAFVACAFWLLRNKRHYRTFASVLAGALLVLSLWQIPELRAQLAATFTNPAGETLAIPVQQISSGGDIAGFEWVDYANGSGAVLTIRSIVLPTYAQCFPGGLTAPLLPPGQPQPSTPATCAVGMTLANGATCRVDVDTRCRSLADASVAFISVNPASLDLYANGPAANVTVTNTSGTLAAQSVAATVPGGSAVIVTTTTCDAILAPGASCTVTFTPPSAAEGPITVPVTGGNTNTVNIEVTVLPGSTLTSINPTSGTTSGNTSFTLTGTGLTGATSVTFDGVSATSITVVDDNTVTGLTPAHAPGTVDVVITSPAGSATLTNGYTYANDFCIPNLCQNGAACVSDPAGGYCNCPFPYFGLYCELEL